MGNTQHAAFIVTSSDEASLREARYKARELFEAPNITSVSLIMRGSCNRYASFLIAPTGSKLGWKEAIDMDNARELFVRYVLSTNDEEGDSSLEVVEIEYGDHGSRIVWSNTRDKVGGSRYVLR